MLNSFIAVYLREILILKRRITRQILSMSVSPLLYMIAFGYAIGGGAKFNGHTYREFLIPGLVAMSSMTQSFAIAVDINVARFYWHIFEEFQAAPVSNTAYVAGEVLAGITRALLSVVIILGIGVVFGVSLDYGNLGFWLGVGLNSFVFASLAVGLAMLVKSHADQAMFASFVITPMAFLGGTFFPLKCLPVWAQKILFFLPLTHAANAIRTSSFGTRPQLSDYLLLAGIGAASFVFAIISVKRARD